MSKDRFNFPHSDSRAKWFSVLCVVALGCCGTLFAQSSTASSGLSAAELQAAASLGETISTSEWLGPLAPVALSPFFGMACLAGMAQYGPESLTASNGLLSAQSPLHQPAVFWTFAVLAVMTSLPRLTKVSKPIAGALEQLESYSSIISLVAIRYLVTGGGEAAPSGEEIVYAAGIGSITVDALLSVAAAINIVVINAVKFFFEFLIWLIPFPLLDALFEACNKAVVAGLMALYSFSPTAATVLNLCMFAICGVIFIWTRRQVVFLRTILVGWVLNWIRTGKPPYVPDFVVFPKSDFGPFPARERLVLSRTSDGMVLTRNRMFGRPLTHEFDEATRVHIEPGWIAHTVIVRGPDAEPLELLLSRSHTKHLEVVAALLRVRVIEVEGRRDVRNELGPLSAKPGRA